MDLNGARRKNATRETTMMLKEWLNQHRKNPYPTKGEKIMLAIVTKMTLTQVSTWFANARRRLKKENKMTWSPRNRCEEDEAADAEAEKAENGDGRGTSGRGDDGGSRSTSPSGSSSHRHRDRSPSRRIRDDGTCQSIRPLTQAASAFAVQATSLARAHAHTRSPRPTLLMPALPFV